MMSAARNLVFSAIVAFAVGGGVMAYDTWSEAEWEVSPTAIATAQAEGKTGLESSPGTVTVRPIRSETADILPYKWVIYGLVAGIVAFITMRKKKAAA